MEAFTTLDALNSNLSTTTVLHHNNDYEIEFIEKPFGDHLPSLRVDFMLYTSI